MTQDTAARELGSKVAGPGRQVFVAGALALTEPGPAASGVVIADAEGHVFAHRSHPQQRRPLKPGGPRAEPPRP